VFSEDKLQNFLRKGELQYRADNDGYKSLDWLNPYCGDTKTLAKFLRQIGLRIERINESFGDPNEEEWVETCTGIRVYCLRDGKKDAFYEKV